MATVDLGKIKFNWTGAWNDSTVYEADDVVSYGGSSYICKQTMAPAAFDMATLYRQYDISYGQSDGNIYIHYSATSSTGQVPELSPSYWTLLSPSTANPGLQYWDLMAEGQSVLTTLGDLMYHDGSNQNRFPIGTTGQVLSVDSSNLAWKPQTGYEGHKYLSTNYANDLADPAATNTYGADGKYPWLADYTNNWVPYCGYANPSCGPVPWDTLGSNMTYRLSFYLNQNHELVVWGDDDRYWLGSSSANKYGQGVVMPFNHEFGGMRDGEYIVRFWMHYNTVWVLTSEGNLFGAGDNGVGQLGIGDTVDRYSLTKIASLGPDATHNGTSCQIAGFHVSLNIDGGSNDTASCYAIDTSGRLFVWGYNSGGKLGIGNTTNQTLPQLVTNITNPVVSVSAGDESAFAIDNAGNLFYTGDNQNGASGGTASTTSWTDTSQDDVYQVVNLDGDYYSGGWVRYAHSYFINESGELYSAGGNATGACGVGNTTAQSTWARVGGSATYSYIVTAGNSYYLTLATIGGTPGNENTTLYHWGYNGSGQCADGTVTNVLSPTQPSSTMLYTYTASSTDASSTPTQTLFSLPRTDVRKVWGHHGGQGQSTAAFWFQDSKYRSFMSGHSQSETYWQNNTGNAALNYYRMETAPWNTTSSVTTSHWAGKTEVTVEHFHSLGYSYGSEGHCLAFTTDGRVWGKWYNGQGQIDPGVNYIEHWIQLTP